MDMRSSPLFGFALKAELASASLATPVRLQIASGATPGFARGDTKDDERARLIERTTSCYHGTMHDFDEFLRLIHEIYPRLHDRAFLEDHPLAKVLGGPSALGAERLHRILIDAIEWLRPFGSASLSSAEWRRYRSLQLRYVEGASPEQISRELQVSPRQARRDHAEALDEIARLLWTRLVPRDTAPAVASASASGRTARHAERRSLPPRSDSLEAEISNLAAVASSLPTRVDEIVRGVVETVSRLSAEHQVQIAVAALETPGPVAVNRTALRQLLLTLLSDAIVRHPGAQIDIQAEHHGQSLALVMRVRAPDQTRSLDATHSDEHCFRVSSSVLEVSIRLAQSLAASLDVQPTEAGGAIRLTLPVSRISTLLLVDDNPDVALLFRRYLGGTTYQLVQARSAERALRLARGLQPDVIILDVLMPSHDGWEILEALRNDPATARLPIVICSVVPDYALAHSLGVTDFLAKPVTRQALLDVLARVQSRHEFAGRQARPESIDRVPPRAIPPAG